MTWKSLGAASLAVLVVAGAAACAKQSPKNPDDDRSSTSDRPGSDRDRTSTGDFPDTKVPGRDDIEGGDVARIQNRLQDVYFDFDRYNLRSDALATMASNSRVLQDNPRARVEIEGHCDERGTTEYNLALGERRAKAARDYLLRAGVEGGRMTTVSYGEERPADPGHDESAWTRNRRAHFRVVAAN